MASFNPTIITKKGHELLIKTMANGINFSFTKVVLSDFIVPDEQKLEDLEILQNHRQIADINKIEILTETSLKISCMINNRDLDEGYFIRAIGLFANNPENDEEILYSITTAIQPDYMPPYKGKSTFSTIIELITAVSNTSNININIDPTNSVSVLEFNKEIQKIYNKIETKAPSEHNHEFKDITDVPDASTDTKGIVQLSSDLNNDSEELGATTKAVKLLSDEIKKVLQAGVNIKNNVISAINSKLSVGDLPFSAGWNEIIEAIRNIKEGRGNAQPGDVLQEKTYTDDSGEMKTGTMPNRGGARTITPTTKNQVLDAGHYSGNITVTGDSDLKAENIKKGVNIFGIVGTLEAIPTDELPLKNELGIIQGGKVNAIDKDLPNKNNVTVRIGNIYGGYDTKTTVVTFGNSLDSGVVLPSGRMFTVSFQDEYGANKLYVSLDTHNPYDRYLVTYEQ